MWNRTVAVAAILAGLSLQPAWPHGRGQQPRSVPYRLEAIEAGSAASFPNSLPEDQFVNYETPHVHPLDLNGDTLVAVNTPDNHLEVFSVSTGVPVHLRSIPVGFDPVSCRFNAFDANEVWVVNQVSDSISVVDLTLGAVVRTLRTDDEPADAVFTTYTRPGFSAQQAAVVSCSRVDRLQVFALADSIDFAQGELIESIYLDGEDPRALAAGALGDVYCAIFESGNSTSIIGFSEGFEQTNPGVQAITNTNNPYGGQTPPYNNVVDPGSAIDFGTAWVTPAGQTSMETIGSIPPPTGLLIRKDEGGEWRDDNGKAWTLFVSGAAAALSGRATGWDVLDNDIAVLAASSGSATEPGYVTRLMNSVMAIGVNPVTNDVMVVGTEATNDSRFEPNITGTFTRVLIATANQTGTTVRGIADLNEAHLAAAQGGAAYGDSSVPQVERNKSIGDPRGIAFSPDGKRIYVTGMGSNNVLVLDGDGTTFGPDGLDNDHDGATDEAGEGIGQRIAPGHAIDVGQGPTGIAYDAARDRLYILNKFDGSLSTVNASTPGSESVINTVKFFDPTPAPIKVGRPHFYNTHQNSGLGQIACASCHIDGRMDRLAWDLGDPLGEVKPVTGAGLMEGGVPGVHNLFRPFGPLQPFDDFHPMKGPMTTQTFQDIIGKEPHHWRGDRDGIEEFAGAWPGLQGADAVLDVISMQEFEAFVASIQFGPNPFRAMDNTLPGGPNLFGGTNPNAPLPGHLATGKFTLALGQQLPNGNAWNGYDRYIHDGLDSGANCVDCHTLPIGAGSTHFTSDTIGGGLTGFTAIPAGPNGESHLAIFAMDNTGENAFKTPHLRNQMDKEGLQLNIPGVPARAGFGILHDGSVAGLAPFIGSDAFAIAGDQDLANLIAFALAINGGFDEIATLNNQLVPAEPVGVVPGPPGGTSHSAHAAIGRQITLRAEFGAADGPTQAELDELINLIQLAQGGWIDLIASGKSQGVVRSYTYASGSGDSAVFDSDFEGQTITHAQLKAIAGPGTEVTYTVVPLGLGHRLGRDRDLDGVLNYPENTQGSDTGNALDHVFVDKNAAPGGTGRPAAPFQTVAPGAELVSPSSGKNGFVHIAMGSYNEAITLNGRARFVADSGLVRIGTN